MPAKSKSQQRLFGMALAVRRGELKKSEVEKEVLDIVNSNMTDKDIEDFASTKHKGLKEYVKESLLDDEDILIKDTGEDTIKVVICKFIYQTYGIFIDYKIRKKKVKGKLVLDSKCMIRVIDKNITSLTNDLFIWGEVMGFDCSGCNSLKSLEGAPMKVNKYFDCSDCALLTSLEGAPKEVKGDFDCQGCKSLKSLKAAPEKIGGDFACDSCDSLTSLKGVPKEIGGSFSCQSCNSLTSLEGAPEKIGAEFLCRRCELLKSLKGVPEIINGMFDCSHCKSLTSLDYFPKKINSTLFIQNIGIENLTYHQIKLLSDIKGNIIK